MHKFRLKRLVIFPSITVLTVLGILWLIDSYNGRQITLARKIVIQEAVAHFDNMVIARRWNAQYGGIFVKPYPGQEPNPYLKNNHIYSADNEQLIKINPSWMTRQLSELTNRTNNFYYRITSNHPINPDNLPDNFEATALIHLEENPSEKYYYRFSHRGKFDFLGGLITEKGCLKCHGIQGYEIGDIRGGIRITLSLDLFNEEVAVIKEKSLFFKVFTIAAGLLAIALFHMFTTRLNRAQNELVDKSVLLESILDSINQGLVAFDADLRLITCNKQYQRIREVPDAFATPGSAFGDWVRFDAERGEFGPDEAEEMIKFQIERASLFEVHDFERKRPDGTIIDVSGGPLPGGGFVSVFSDITERKLAEQQLQDAFAVITGSIQYASRIQRSVLPDDAIIKSGFADHFVLWKPRDVVGGDIYWCDRWGDGMLFILCDCTGHGVPGAFMTLIATGALERSKLDTEVGDVAGLLKRMHQLIQITLGQKIEGGKSDDGLELGACWIQQDRKHMNFSGARFDLFIVENGSVIEIKGTKKGMGYRRIPFDQEYDEHAVRLLPERSFYMTSDGLIDQIGGPKRRMFGKKRFRNLLLSIRDLPFSGQKDEIWKTLVDYEGEEIRRDDISVVGFKF